MAVNYYEGEKMDDELRAAAERLRRVKAKEHIADVYADVVDMPSHAGNAWLCDQAKLADAYLAEHPADEAPPDPWEECKRLRGMLNAAYQRIAAQSAALARHAERQALARREQIAALVYSEWWLMRHRFDPGQRNQTSIAEASVKAAEALTAALDKPTSSLTPEAS